MGQHVDFVKNDWAREERVLVARVRVHNRAVEIEGDQSWLSLAEGALAKQQPRRRPTDSGMLAQIATVDGSYLQASGPHDDADCPFHGIDDTLRMDRVDSPVGTSR